MAKVIVLDNISPLGLEKLEAAEGIDYEVRTKLAGEELRAALASADAAICRSGVKITADVLRGNRRLKALARAGVGTDNIDHQAATRIGVVVMNTPTGNTLSTAEHTVAMMLALSRNIAPAYQSLIEGRWDRKAYMGTQLAGKTLGIVGLGRIGQAVAVRAKALEMRVLGYDPFLSPERTQELGIEPIDEVRSMLPQLDYLTVHTPLNDETRGLIGLDELEIIKPGARLINCARGGIYDEQALVAGLESGKLAGVALDVFADEPCTDSPLFGMPGVVCTPHLGASTEEAQAQVAIEAVDLILDYLRSGAIRHAINVSPIDPQTLERVRGYLDVGYRLGMLLAQLQEGSPRRCRLTYRGDICDKNTKLITASFAAGLLKNALDEEANVVNAELLLRGRGIEVVEESRQDKGAFSSAMTAELETDQRTHRATGTLFGHNMARLVELDQHRLEAFLDGTMMIFHHRDVPGIIGAIGTIFGSHQVNIAQMAVGRAGSQAGAEAVGVLNLDTDPPAGALQQVLDHQDIQHAVTIHLPKAGELPGWLKS